MSTGHYSLREVADGVGHVTTTVTAVATQLGIDTRFNFHERERRRCRVFTAAEKAQIERKLTGALLGLTEYQVNILNRIRVGELPSAPAGLIRACPEVPIFVLGKLLRIYQGEVKMKERGGASASKTVEPVSDKAALTEPLAELESGKKLDPEVSDLIQRGWELKEKIGPLEAELGSIKAQLKQKYKRGVVATLPGVCRLMVTTRDSVGISAGEDELRAVLGERFDDLVEVKVKLMPTDKLLGLSKQNDVLGKAIRGCLECKTELAVNYRKV